MTDTPASTEPADAGPAETEIPAAPAVPAARRRPVRKPSKPDAVLAAAVDAARNGVLEIAGDTPVGDHLGAFPEAERLVTHRFTARVPGYGGWYWFATLARVPRGKEVTVCEVGLLPSEDALLAPDWVPWSERVRPEDTAEEVAAPDAAAAAQDVAPAHANVQDVAAQDVPVVQDPVDVEPTGASLEEPFPAGSSSAPGDDSPVA